jgi:hypothetical protein
VIWDKKVLKLMHEDIDVISKDTTQYSTREKGRKERWKDRWTDETNKHLDRETDGQAY